MPGVMKRPLPPTVSVQTTLSRGPLRISYRMLGMTRACVTHDAVVARRLKRMKGQVDVVHAWPLGARRTLEVAAELDIPTFLERPNAHTRFAFEAVAAESARLGIVLPKGSEHAYDADVLRIEEAEYALADHILCPSEFVKRTFLDRGFDAENLTRHTYGFDSSQFYPRSADAPERPFTVLFAGYAAVRKGLHFALEAWLRSPAAEHGRFLIAGGIMPAYATFLAEQLAHPSVQVLGLRNDMPDLMRDSDVMVLPSIEEGFGLVCVEAMASGCVPVVSDACTDVCRHDDNALVHAVGDVDTLAQHITQLYEDPTLLETLRRSGVSTAAALTWKAAGETLLTAYRSAL